MTRMDDGWVEVPAVHEPIVQTRFANKKRSPTERDKESYSQGAAAGTPLASPLSLSIGFHMVRGLAWRLLSIPLLKSPSPLRRSLHRCWLQEGMMIPQLESHRQLPSDVGQVQRRWCRRLEDHREACSSSPCELVDW